MFIIFLTKNFCIRYFCITFFVLYECVCFLNKLPLAANFLSYSKSVLELGEIARSRSQPVGHDPFEESNDFFIRTS